MLSSIPVTWRMIASSLGPILGLLVFTFVIGTGQINNAQNMDKVAQSTEFTRDLSNLVHQLQRERGRSAGFVGSNGATSYRTALEAQRTHVFRSCTQPHGLRNDVGSRVQATVRQIVVALGNESSLVGC